MKSKKFLLLAITISFPVIFYLFLRSFGQNEYDLPYFFQDEGIACSDALGFVDVSVLDLSNSQDTLALNVVLDNTVSIVLFPSLDNDNQSLKNELNRTGQNLKGKLDLRFIAFYDNDSSLLNSLSLEDIKVDNYGALAGSYNELVSCNFKLPSNLYTGQHPAEEQWPVHEILVLIDEQDQIRGYYNGFETKDVDRLILEVNVLLSKK
ncbi:MAG: protein SCO1/2 [Marivirga sp.]|jgi:protein SCO1/2